MAGRPQLHLWFCFLLGQAVLGQGQPQTPLAGSDLERRTANLELLFGDLVRTQEAREEAQSQLQVEKWVTPSVHQTLTLPLCLLVSLSSLSLCLSVFLPLFLTRRLGPTDRADADKDLHLAGQVSEAENSAAMEAKFAELQMLVRSMEGSLLQQLQAVTSAAVETRVAELQMLVRNMEGSLLQQMQETSKTSVEKMAGELQRQLQEMEGSVVLQLQGSMTTAAVERKLEELKGNIHGLEGSVDQLQESGTSAAVVEAKLEALQAQVRGLESCVQQLQATLRMQGDRFASDPERFILTAKEDVTVVDNSRVFVREMATRIRHSVVGVAKLVAAATLVGWKVSFENFPDRGVVFAGIIGDCDSSDSSHKDSSSYGWSSADTSGWPLVWIAGERAKSDLSPFQQGDSLIFLLDAARNRLCMAIVRTRETAEVQLPGDLAREARLHLNLPRAGTEIQVSPVAFNEVASAGLLSAAAQ